MFLSFLLSISSAFSEKYSSLPEEAFIVNALAMVLVGLAILLVYAVRRETFRVRIANIISQRL